MSNSNCVPLSILRTVVLFVLTRRYKNYKCEEFKNIFTIQNRMLLSNKRNV